MGAYGFTSYEYCIFDRLRIFRKFVRGNSETLKVRAHVQHLRYVRFPKFLKLKFSNFND